MPSATEFLDAVEPKKPSAVDFLDQSDKSQTKGLFGLGGKLEPAASPAETTLETPTALRPSIGMPIARAIDYIAQPLTGGRAAKLADLLGVSTRELRPGEQPIPEIPLQESKVGEIAAGVGNVPIRFANFALSPEGVALGQGIGMVPKMIRTLAGILFGAEEAKAAIQSPTLQEAVTHGLGAVALGAGTIIDARTGKVTQAPEGTVIPDASRIREDAKQIPEIGNVQETGPSQSSPNLELAPQRETSSGPGPITEVTQPEGAGAVPSELTPAPTTITAAEGQPQSFVTTEAVKQQAVPNDFTPALKTSDGTVIKGEQGQAHQNIYEAQTDPTALRASEPEHGFVDKEGNFKTRQDVSTALGEADPMQSERLAELQQNPVQHGEFNQEGYTAIEPKVTGDDPHVSTIANRFVKERAAKGQVGEISPGQGYSVRDLAERGLKMSPEEVNQHVSDMMQGGGDPVLQAAAIRGEEARLSERSAQLSRALEADPKNTEARLAADNAFKDLTDFHNGPVAQLKQNWANQGRAMQGEIPVDLSTFNGLREQWLRDTGKPPPANVEATLQRTAQNVAKAVTEENSVRSRLAQEVEKVTSRRKFPTADEVRDSIRERMGLEPC